MLIDDVKQQPSDKWGAIITPEVAEVVKGSAHRARCYVFDKAASFKLGQFIASCPDIIADQLEFANEPYDVTYIEMEIDAVIDGIGKARTAAGPKADWKIGFLRNGLSVFVLVCGREPKAPDVFVGVYGFAYTDGNQRMVVYQDDDIRERATVHMLGTTYNDLTAAQRKKFTDRYASLYYGPKTTEEVAFREIMEGHMGEVRIYAAALLLLQQKKGVMLSERSAYRAMYRGKSRPFMAHNTVTITLDGPVQIRRAFNHTGETRRAHEVPSHYAHRHGTRNCEHVWSKREAEENHWDCTKCGRFRYLRRQHMRGDASKGFVKKSYNVTTENAR